MKNIMIVYRNGHNPEVIGWIRNKFEEIFKGYAKVESCYANELRDGDRISADAYVLAERKLLLNLKEHASNLKNSVLLSRSVKKEYLGQLNQIPRGTKVLVINDTYRSSAEMLFTLYGLGIEHLNYTVFTPECEERGEYEHIRYAITPNEVHMVPDRIENVINIGYREIGFDTLVQLMNVLDLNNEVINYRLINYISTIVEPEQDFQISYCNSFLKGKMLNEYVYDSDDYVFLVNADGKLVYTNKKARDLFNFTVGSADNVERHLPQEIRDVIKKDDDVEEQVITTADGDTFIMFKRNVTVNHQSLGYFVLLQNEIVLKDKETIFHNKMRETGYYARYQFSDICHKTNIIRETVNLAKKAAVTENKILLCGESGTGKELFAQSIHNFSKRKGKPFVGVNCAAIPEALLESELFGYEEGAFTGARKKGKIGYFEQVNGGTIFLDEIGDMPHKLQSKLLRVLQEQQIMRLGSDKVVNIDVRIISATNRDLLKEVEKGNFRADLYYRLNTIQITIPPLRKRKGDILYLFGEFMGKDFYKVSMEERDKLMNYDWPGNVRELENCAQYYKAIDKLPGQFDYETCDYDNLADMKEDNLEEIVLSNIRSAQSYSHGLGRIALREKLKRQNVHISDSRLRRVLSGLSDQGFIEIGKGRQGTTITSLGETFLRNINR